MKIRYLLFIVFVSSAFLYSCEDLDENPKAMLTPGTYFKTPEELEGVIAAMYRRLAPDDAWGFTCGFTSYFGGDDLATHPASNKQDFRNFDRLEGDAANREMVNQWQGPWRAIYQANAVLTSVNNVQFRDNVDKERAIGQASFIRAIAYYYLTRTFGDIPIVTESVDVDDRLPRQPMKDVYTQVIEDLTIAENALPDSWPNQPGKATKYAAKALLADVYMNMAGYPLNETDKYALAAAKAKEVIDANKYTLVSNYGDVFKTNNNSESIFALQYNTTGGLPRRSTGQFVVPEEETSLAGEAGWHDYCSEVNFFRNAPKCERTDETFLTIVKKRVGTTQNFDILAWDDMGTSTQHPYFKKFRYGVAAAGTTIGDGLQENATQIIKMNASTDKTLDLIRYSGVLLNYAECSTMAGSGPSADAYNAINRVRNRAGLPDLTAGLGKEAFRDSVVFERAYEFAGEFGVRWFDIVRLQLLPQVIAARQVGTHGVNQYWENQLNANYTTGANLQTRYLAPIPQSEMDRNKEWIQNPGY